MTTENFPFFDFLTGWAIFLSLLTLALCLATLRNHVDEAKIREEKSIAKTFRSPLPPEHVLTAAGKRRVKLAKIALGVSVVCFAAMIVRTQLLAP